MLSLVFLDLQLHPGLIYDYMLQALELFRKQEVDFLIATDVAARVSGNMRLKTVLFILLDNINITCLALF